MEMNIRQSILPDLSVISGVLYQALRDVSAWVEKGVPPPPSTSYKVVDGQIVVPVDGRLKDSVYNQLFQ